MNHRGRRAIISGGAGGIGSAVASRLRDDGAAVYSLDVASGNLPGVEDVPCDVSDELSVTAALDFVRSHHGAPDIVVHCAAAQSRVPFAELSIEEWHRAFRVNVDGAFHLIRGVLPDMRARGWGRIILFGSSSFVSPTPELSHYIATKGALVGLARGLAAELGREGITINVLAPGLTETPSAVGSLPADLFDRVLDGQAIPRRGLATDQAGLVSFLASEDAGFLTGQTILNDGGQGRL